MAWRAGRKLVVGCSLGMVSIALTGLLAEGAFRLAKAVFGRPSIYQHDARLGWVPISNVRYDFTLRAQNGEAYVVDYATNEFGFRLWGDPTSDRPRIAFIGDSFTQDPNMSNEFAYFSQVARALPVEVFAVGGGGYGTLQELLILDRYWTSIKPTHVVLQFCSNDVQNNHYGSEALSIVRAQKNFRPYFVDGQFLYRDAPYYRFFARHSSLFRFLDERLQNLQYSWFGGYSRPKDADRIAALRANAVTVTREILHMIKDLGREGVKWYMFSCSAANSEWINLAEATGFQPIRGVADAVAAAAAQQLSVHTADGAHWNDLGHEIAGQVISEHLEKELSPVTDLELPPADRTGGGSVRPDELAK